MRPIRRGVSPQATDFAAYEDAKVFLVGRLGLYCSFCERVITTMLAVEHIQPKGLPAYEHLIGRWENFLLACVNCNSTKLNKNVILSEILLPDRDNTFTAFLYLPDGTVIPSNAAIAAGIEATANRTLALTGLDKPSLFQADENGKQVALDRAAQRMEAWLIAESARADFDVNPNLEAIRRLIVENALAKGFFSVWLTVFLGRPVMCLRLIEAFAGTLGSGCFSTLNAALISPAPNHDHLPHGAKI